MTPEIQRLSLTLIKNIFTRTAKLPFLPVQRKCINLVLTKKGLE